MERAAILLDEEVIISEIAWQVVVLKAQEELKSLKKMAILYGSTLPIMTRTVIIEEGLKLYQSGSREEELYDLLAG